MLYFLQVLFKRIINVIIMILVSPVVAIAYLYGDIKRLGLIGTAKKYNKSLSKRYQDYFNGYANLSPQFIHCDDGKKLFEYRLIVGLHGNYNSFMSIGICSANELVKNLNSFLLYPKNKLLDLTIEYGGNMSQTSLINRNQAQKIIALYDELNSQYESYKDDCEEAY